MRSVRALLVCCAATALVVSGVASPAAAAANRPGIVDLGTLGGEVAQATAVNNRGQVVGYSDPGGGRGHHAYLWTRGAMTDLGVLPGGVYSAASDISDRGVIVGSSSVAGGDYHAVLWR